MHKLAPPPTASPARAMWTLYEPVHTVTYFSPEARAEFTDAGLRGFWRGYFAGRAAPLGPVGAAPVVAAFFGFAPPMVARAIPDVWRLASVERVLAARLDGAVRALRRLMPPGCDETLEEIADLMESASTGLDHAGRVLGAANAALPRPAEPIARVWQCATLLREHRGDAHVATLVAAGLGGCDALRWRASTDLTREVLQQHRGWSDEAWDASTAHLIDLGWLDGDAGPTQSGFAAYQAIEEATDRAATEPWRRLGPGRTDRLRELLAPIALACHAELPEVTPIGLPKPMVGS